MSNINNNINYPQELVTGSQLDSYVMDPTKLSYDLKNMEGNELNKPIKYKPPKYTEKIKKTYQVLEPIRQKSVIMPETVSTKVRTTEPIFQKPIYVEGKEALNKALYDEKYFGNEADIPLPTASVINNLCQPSVIQSSFLDEALKSRTSQNDFNYNQQALKSNQQKQSNIPQNYTSQYKEQLMTKTSGINNPNDMQGSGIKKDSMLRPSVHEGVGLNPSTNIQNSKGTFKYSNRKARSIIEDNINILQICLIIPIHQKFLNKIYLTNHHPTNQKCSNLI